MSHPTSFDQIVGQRNAKEALRVEISRARRRNEPLPHLLLTGSPGLGKSMLARVLAAEMGVTFRKVAPGRLKPADVERVIFHESGDLTDHDVLLLEEAHALFAGGETTMSWLLDTLTDFELLGHAIPKITFCWRRIAGSGPRRCPAACTKSASNLTATTTLSNLSPQSGWSCWHRSRHPHQLKRTLSPKPEPQPASDSGNPAHAGGFGRRRGDPASSVPTIMTSSTRFD